MPEGWVGFQLPDGMRNRLKELLDRQDQGHGLNSAERDESEGLVDLAEWLSLLRLHARRISAQSNLQP